MIMVHLYGLHGLVTKSSLLVDQLVRGIATRPRDQVLVPVLGGLLGENGFRCTCRFQPPFLIICQ